MSSRWIIPFLISLFSIFAAVTWIYLDRTQFAHEQDTVLADLAAITTTVRPAPRTLTQTTPPPSNPPTPALPRRQTRSRPTGPSLWDTVPALADRLDEQLVNVRADIHGATLVRHTQAINDLRADRATSALRRFDRILAHSPRNTAALSGKAETLVVLQRSDEACDTYKRLIKTAPADANARYNYGVILCRQGSFNAAAEQFYEAVAIDPDHARAWFNLASLSQRDGKLTQARRAWQRVTALDPANATGWFQLGTIEMDLDAFESAIFCFTYAAAISPDDLAAHLNLALAFAAAGDPYQAFDTAAHAHDRFPCDLAVDQLFNELTEVFPDAVAIGLSL